MSCKDREKLSEIEEWKFRTGHCPDCDSDDIREGPSGGMCVNFMCFGCGSKFNEMSVFGVDRISDKSPDRKCDPVGACNSNGQCWTHSSWVEDSIEDDAPQPKGPDRDSFSARLRIWWCGMFGHRKIVGDGFVAPQWFCKNCDWIGPRLTNDEMKERCG